MGAWEIFNFHLLWTHFGKKMSLQKMHYSQVMSYLAKVVMSIPGPLIRDGGNTNPSYQLQPLVSTDLTRGFLSWLGATREISWYSGLELILGVRILPPSLMGSRYRYNILYFSPVWVLLWSYCRCNAVKCVCVCCTTQTSGHSGCKYNAFKPVQVLWHHIRYRAI